MNNKKPIIIPPLSSFGNTLGIQDRKIKAALFIPNKSNYANLSSLESTLNQLKFLNIVGWFTSEKGFQRGSHKVKKIFDLYTKKGIDIIICYSKEDLLGYGSSLEGTENSIKSCRVPLYCIKDCILIKDNEIIISS